MTKWRKQIIFNSTNTNADFAPKSNKNVTQFIWFFINIFKNEKENTPNNSYPEQINESEGQSLKYWKKN